MTKAITKKQLVQMQVLDNMHRTAIITNLLLASAQAAKELLVKNYSVSSLQGETFGKALIDRAVEILTEVEADDITRYYPESAEQ